MKTINSSVLRKLILVAMIFIAFLIPLFTNNSYYLTLFDQAMINMIVVMGLNFITGLTGQMNMGTAAFFALGAYSVALGHLHFGLSAWAGLGIAIVVGLLLGRGLGYPSLRIHGFYLTLTTIGFCEIVRLLLLNLSDLTGGALGVREIPGFSVFGVVIRSERSFYYFLLVFVVLAAFISWRIVNSKWGRAFKAIKDNPEAAESCGINTAKIKILAFTLAAVFGSVGGAFYASLMGYISPNTFTTELSTNYLVMMMIGGIGSVGGNIVGAALVTILPEILRFLKEYYWLIFSIITLLFAIFFPYGLASLPRIMMGMLGGKQKGGVSLENNSQD